MNNNELEVKLKIGEIEFYAKGQAGDVEIQRQNFTDIILPAAVEAIKSARGDKAFIAPEQTPSLPPAKESDVLEVQSDMSDRSVNEFINEKGFRSQMDVSMGLIYYFEMFKACSDFSSNELKQYFKDAKISPIPANPSDVVSKLTKKSYIMSSDDKKRYCLTQNGIRFVEEYIPKETKTKNTTGKSKRTRIKAESTYSNITADDLHLEKYPKLSSFKSPKEQVILCMYIVDNEKQGEWFTVNDVVYIMMNVFGVQSNSKLVSNVFYRNRAMFQTEQDSNNKKADKKRLLSAAKELAQELIVNNLG